MTESELRYPKEKAVQFLKKINYTEDTWEIVIGEVGASHVIRVLAAIALGDERDVYEIYSQQRQDDECYPITRQDVIDLFALADDELERDADIKKA
jgi:hypothetical protein